MTGMTGCRPGRLGMHCGQLQASWIFDLQECLTVCRSSEGHSQGRLLHILIETVIRNADLVSGSGCRLCLQFEYLCNHFYYLTEVSQLA